MIENKQQLSFPGWGIAQRIGREAGYAFQRLADAFRSADISLFHEFVPPPAGGGHQFLRALKREWERKGYRVEVNTVSGATRACLLNSFNFDADRFRYLRRKGCRVVHRVDGPLAVYRGADDGADEKIVRWNREFADATIFQSLFSRKAHQKMGLVFQSPLVIPNAADPQIFFPPKHREPLEGRKLKVLSASWSDNRNKGADVYEWLDLNLDFDRVEYTFVGRIASPLRNIRVCPPTDSVTLAQLLREQDVYLTASKNDPCSNSLIEALSSGLPAVYLDSGGHPEIAGEAGLAFSQPEEIPALLDRMSREIDIFRERIRVASIEDVAMQYLQVLGMAEEPAQ